MKILCKWFGHKWHHFEIRPSKGDYCKRCGTLWEERKTGKFTPHK